MAPSQTCSLLAALLLALPVAAPAAAAEGPVGVVRPSREVVLKAPLSGALAEVLVAEGQRVEAGELLARVDDAVQAARVAAARVRAAGAAEVAEAAANVEAAERELGRTREAAATGAAPAWELEAAETAVTVAEARRVAATERHALAGAELAVEEALLRRHRLTAPFAGVVLAVEADPGSSLSAQDPVLRLATLDPLEATVYVPAEHHRLLRPEAAGTDFRLVPRLPGAADLDATLTAALPEIDPGSRSFRCVFRIDNPGAALPTGFTVELELPGPE